MSKQCFYHSIPSPTYGSVNIALCHASGSVEVTSDAIDLTYTDDNIELGRFRKPNVARCTYYFMCSCFEQLESAPSSFLGSIYPIVMFQWFSFERVVAKEPFRLSQCKD